MKKKGMFMITMSLLLTIFFSSCSVGSLFKKILGKISSDHGADAEEYAIMIKVLNAIQSKDENAMRKLFSSKTVEQVDGFDQSMEDLFDYYQGEYISLDWKGSGGDGTYEYGEKRITTSVSYDVKTSNNIFRFAIKYCSTDTTGNDNIGIHSLYIIKFEDDTDPECGYGGDGKYSPGIHIGIRNVLTTEVD